MSNQSSDDHAKDSRNQSNPSAPSSNNTPQPSNIQPNSIQPTHGQPVQTSSATECTSSAQQILQNQKMISFSELADGKKVVVIELDGQHYRLRLTKSGRLVLTK